MPRTLLLLALAATIAASAQQHPTYPTRDSHTPGYVRATQLPDGTLPAPTRDGNFILGPTHPPAPEMSPNPSVPHGAVIEFTMTSDGDPYYPGIARDPGTSVSADPAHPERPIVTTSNPHPWTRTVAVYVPQQYVPGTPAPFLVGADGPDSSVYPALDNLIAAHKIPALVFISIANGGGDAQGSERGLEYDTMSGKYAEWVEHVVLPLAESKAHVTLTHDPDGRAAMGGSSGGAVSLIMAWYHPEWYHRVLAYSGTWINQQWPWNPATPHGAWGFVDDLVANSPRKPIRIWMEVGDRDLYNPNAMRDGMHDWVLANEKMAAALAAKHYHYQFLFAENAGHVDHATKLQTLPEALEYVWQVISKTDRRAASPKQSRRTKLPGYRFFGSPERMPVNQVGFVTGHGFTACGKSICKGTGSAQGNLVVERYAWR
ncbi:MAG: alpha/beta hydrolase-fold protein [Acidobacteriaceae bacterium]